MWYDRTIQQHIEATLQKNKSILLFGPRQTGKTSLISKIKHDKYINFMEEKTRNTYAGNLNRLSAELKALRKNSHRIPLVVIDEVQKIPNITDEIQVLIDNNIAQFILTGSSARKIKNLLPGRVIKFNMYSLSLSELAKNQDVELETILINGMLPEIHTSLDQDLIEQQLETYVHTYIEEEIRKEALVRNVTAFNNFFRLACIESGNIVNFSSISQEVGIAHSTIREYYNILQECMLVEQIQPITKSNTRRRLSKSSKYILYDLGVRRVGAIEGNKPTLKQKSLLFEQFIGLELIKLLAEKKLRGKLCFWRSHDGPEVDYILDIDGQYIPIEVKWNSSPSIKDAKHLITFRSEYPNTANMSYIICRTENQLLLEDKVLALPWQQIDTVLHKFFD